MLSHVPRFRDDLERLATHVTWPWKNSFPVVDCIVENLDRAAGPAETLGCERPWGKRSVFGPEATWLGVRSHEMYGGQLEDPARSLTMLCQALCLAQGGSVTEVGHDLRWSSEILVWHRHAPKKADIQGQHSARGLEIARRCQMS